MVDLADEPEEANFQGIGMGNIDEKKLSIGADHIKNRVQVQFIKYLLDFLRKESNLVFTDEFEEQVIVWLIGSDKTKSDPKMPNLGELFGDWFEDFAGTITEGQFVEIYFQKPEMVIKSMIDSGFINAKNPMEYLQRLVEQFRMGPGDEIIGDRLVESGEFEISKGVRDIMAENGTDRTGTD